jgi:lysophospholipase L1-like esterase
MMRSWISRVWISIALAGACSSPPPESGSESSQSVALQELLSARLERDVGGPERLMRFFREQPEPKVRELLQRYGMEVVYHRDTEARVGEVEGEAQSKAIADPEADKCPQLFPQEDRNTWHLYDDEYYFVDGSGRPESAYTHVPPIRSSGRSGWCQGNVGRWGNAENPANDYDGGHLIGARLGGWGQRLNLVPQHRHFNRGNWAQLENSMAKCAAVEPQRVLYRITVAYPDATRLVPQTFSVLLQDRLRGGETSLEFQNVAGGGANGTSERNRGSSFLAEHGCTAHRNNLIEQNDPDELEIMMVGDSITHGDNGHHTWRYRLHEHLRRTNVRFDFVGPSEAPLSGAYATAGWDDAHAALWGQSTSQAKELIAEDVQIHQPDIVLIDLGTNDMTWLNGTPRSTRDDMADLIARARAVKPDTQFVLAKIGDTGPLEDGETTGYNQELEQLASQASSAISRVVTADVAGSWNWSTDTYDQTHPNARGEHVIAKAFAEALFRHFSVGGEYGDVPFPPPQPGPPKPTGIVVEPGAVKRDQPFTVRWERVHNPGIWTPYRVRVHNHFAFGGALIWESPETPDTSFTYNGPPLPQTGVYHIVVVATDGTNSTPSDPVPLTVGDGPPKPGGIVVQPHAVRRDQPFSVSWERVVNPGIWTPYRVRVRNHRDFGFAVIWESPETPYTSLVYSGAPLPQNGVYHITVVATDGTFETESEPVPLIVGDGPPKPTGIAVAPAAVRRNEPFTVSWQRVNNPGVWTPYKVRVHNHFAYGGALIWESPETPDTSWTYNGPPLPQAGIYHIVVASLDGTFESASDPVPLTVSDGPPKPTGIVLSPPVVTRDQRFTVSWQRVDNPGIWTPYRVRVHNHFAYGGALIWESPETPDTSFTYNGPPLPQTGIYHVVVVATDGTFESPSDLTPLQVIDYVPPPPPPPPPPQGVTVWKDIGPAGATRTFSADSYYSDMTNDYFDNGGGAMGGQISAIANHTDKFVRFGTQPDGFFGAGNYICIAPYTGVMNLTDVEIEYTGCPPGEFPIPVKPSRSIQEFFVWLFTRGCMGDTVQTYRQRTRVDVNDQLWSYLGPTSEEGCRGRAAGPGKTVGGTPTIERGMHGAIDLQR